MGTFVPRRIAILIASGIDGKIAAAMHSGLSAAGAVPRYVGIRLGKVATEQGDAFDVEVTLEAISSVLYDALVIPSGKAAIDLLGTVGHAAEFIKDQYRHCKPITAFGAGTDLVKNAGVPTVLPSGDEDPGLILLAKENVKTGLQQFIQAIGLHRHYARQVDPPLV